MAAAPINCRLVERKLRDYVARTLPSEDSQRIGAHICGCRRCRRRWRQVLNARAFAAALPDVHLSEAAVEECLQRALRALDQNEPPNSSRPVRARRHSALRYRTAAWFRNHRRFAYAASIGPLLVLGIILFICSRMVGGVAHLTRLETLFACARTARDSGLEAMMAAYTDYPIERGVDLSGLLLSDTADNSQPASRAGSVLERAMQALLASRTDDALALLEEDRRSSSEPSAANLRLTGHALLSSNRPREAIDWYARAAYVDPADGLAVFASAYCSAMLGDFTSARQEYDRATRLLRVGPQTREHRMQLASSLNNRGALLFHAEAHEDALAALEKAVEIRRALWHEFHNTDEANFLASALLNKADTLEALHRRADAQTIYLQVIEMLEKIGPSDDQLAVRYHLGRAHLGLGVLSTLRNDFKSARSHFADALAIFRRLDEQTHLPIVRDILAMVLGNLASADRKLRRQRDALDEFREAQSLRQQQVRVDGFERHAYSIAALTDNIGTVLGDLGRYKEAFQCHNDCIYICRQLVTSSATDRNRRLLGTSLNNRGLASRNLNRLQEALTDFEESLAIRTCLVEENRTESQLAELAGTQANRATTLALLDRPTAALDAVDEALVLFTHLVERKDSEAYLGDLAGTHSTRSHILRNLGDPVQALQDSDEAVQALSSLVASGRDEFLPSLSIAYIDRSHALLPVGYFGEAREDATRAIIAIQEMILRLQPFSSDELSLELAIAFNVRARAAASGGDFLSAIGDFTTAIDIRLTVFERTGDGQTLDDASESLWLRANALLLNHNTGQAVRDLWQNESITCRLIEEFGSVTARGRRMLVRSRLQQIGSIEPGG